MGNFRSCLHLKSDHFYDSSISTTTTKLPASPPIQSMPTPHPTATILSITRAHAKERQKHSYSPTSTSRFSFSSFFHPTHHQHQHPHLPPSPTHKEPPTPFSLSSSPSFSHLRVETDDNVQPAIHIDHRQKWLNSTPSSHSTLAVQFPHYCPLCMRYFQSIYSTSCCSHNICMDCTERYIASKLPAYLPLSFIPTIALPLACPHCTQTSTPVSFNLLKDDTVDTSVSSENNNISSMRKRREYVESPRTKAALARSEESRRKREEELRQLHVLGQPTTKALEPIMLIDLLANVNRSSSSSSMMIDPLNQVTESNPIRVMA